MTLDPTYDYVIVLPRRTAFCFHRRDRAALVPADGECLRGCCNVITCSSQQILFLNIARQTFQRFWRYRGLCEGNPVFPGNEMGLQYAEITTGYSYLKPVLMTKSPALLVSGDRLPAQLAKLKRRLAAVVPS